MKTNSKQSSDIIRATIAFAIASFATSGMNYVVTPIITRLLSASEYGVIAIYNSWFSIVQVILSMTLIFPGILNVGLYEYRERRYQYLSNMLGIIITATVFFSIVYGLFHSSVETWLDLPPSLIILMLLSCIGQSATTLWLAKERYEYSYKMPIIVSMGSALLSQLVSIMGIILFKNSGTNLAVIRLWGAGIVNNLVGLFIATFIFLNGKQFFSRVLWHDTIVIAIPLIPHYLSSVALIGTDKIMIGKLVGEDKAGIYNLAAIISAIGVLVWRALRMTFTPFVNHKLGKRDYDSIFAGVKPLWILSALFSILGAALSPDIINVLATKEYLQAINAVPPIIIGLYLHSIYDTFAAVSFFHKKSSAIAAASVIAAITNVFLNVIGIKMFGFIAAGYTTMISHAILVILHYLNTRRIEKQRIYDFKWVVISVLLVSAVCLGCIPLYSLNPIFRYAIAVLILVYIVIKKRYFICSIKELKV